MTRRKEDLALFEGGFIFHEPRSVIPYTEGGSCIQIEAPRQLTPESPIVNRLEEIDVPFDADRLAEGNAVAFTHELVAIILDPNENLSIAFVGNPRIFSKQIAQTITHTFLAIDPEAFMEIITEPKSLESRTNLDHMYRH